MKKLSLAICILLASKSAVYATETATATPVGDAQAGAKKVTTCIACHGQDGNTSLMPLYPKLGGQHASYLAVQLSKFKSGVRNEPTMTPMAKPLSDQDMLDIAAYFGSQARKLGEASNQELAQKGRAIYLGGNKTKGVPACMACHSPTGLGNSAAKYPVLSGQNAAYVEKQLNDYKNGVRGSSGTDMNETMMRDIAMRLSPEEIKAVADYAAGLH